MIGLFLLTLTATLYLGQSISTGIDANKQFCSQIAGKKDKTFTLTFVSSGFQEEQLEVKLFDPHKRLIKMITKQKEAVHKELLMENGLYEVCFKPLDKYYKLISFDFDLSDTDKGLVLSETMDQVAKELQNAYSDMQKISKNQHYQADRESTHQSLLEQTEKQLQWCSIGKMVVLVLICISQIYMLTSFFKNKSFGSYV